MRKAAHPDLGMQPHAHSKRSLGRKGTSAACNFISAAASYSGHGWPRLPVRRQPSGSHRSACRISRNCASVRGGSRTAAASARVRVTAARMNTHGAASGLWCGGNLRIAGGAERGQRPGEDAVDWLAGPLGVGEQPCAIALRGTEGDRRALMPVRHRGQAAMRRGLHLRRRRRRRPGIRSVRCRRGLPRLSLRTRIRHRRSS